MTRKRSPSNFYGEDAKRPANLVAACTACGESWPIDQRAAHEASFCRHCGAGAAAVELRKVTSADSYTVVRAAQ